LKLDRERYRFLVQALCSGRHLIFYLEPFTAAHGPLPPGSPAARVALMVSGDLHRVTPLFASTDRERVAGPVADS